MRTDHGVPGTQVQLWFFPIWSGRWEKPCEAAYSDLLLGLRCSWALLHS